MKDYKLSDLEDLSDKQLEKLIQKFIDKKKEIKILSNDNVDSPSKQDENIKLLKKQRHYRNQLHKIDAFYKWKYTNDHTIIWGYFPQEELDRVRLKFDRLKKLERIIGD